MYAGFATLPAEGDYLTCAATSEDTSALSAGLTLTSQLVAGLFDVWDVLPALAPKRPLNFGLDFASVPSYDDEDSAVRRKFARKVHFSKVIIIVRFFGWLLVVQLVQAPF